MFAPHFLPGYKAGGPIKSLANLFLCLGVDHTFKLLTSDRDLGDLVRYDFLNDNSSGDWRCVGNIEVRYLNAENLKRASRIFLSLRGECPDIIYLNSFFSPAFSIFPLLCTFFRLVPRAPVLIAPRGELSSEALSIKARKKKVYMFVSRILALHKNVFWHASSEFEAKDIATNFGAPMERIFVASDLPTAPSLPVPEKSGNVSDDVFRICFLSRISEIKNLDYCLDVLRAVTAPVCFNIYGPVEDVEFLRKCQEKASSLRSNIQVHFMGPVFPQDVARIISEHDLFFLPSKSENYAHVIAEALSVGTEVLISDRTPWRGLDQRGLGRDFALEEPTRFSEFIEKRSRMSGAERQKLRSGIVHAYFQEWESSEDIQKNRKMFLQVIGRQRQ